MTGGRVLASASTKYRYQPADITAILAHKDIGCHQDIDGSEDIQCMLVFGLTSAVNVTWGSYKEEG